MRDFNVYHYFSKNQISLIKNIFPKEIIKEISNNYDFYFTMGKKSNKKLMASKVTVTHIEQEDL